MPQGLCHSIAITRRASPRIGSSAYSQNNGIRRKHLAIAEPNAANLLLLLQNDTDPAVGFHRHLELVHRRQHSIDSIGGSVALGKDAPAALQLCRYPMRIEELNDCLVVKSAQGTVQKYPIAGDILYDLRDIRCIGNN